MKLNVFFFKIWGIFVHINTEAEAKRVARSQILSVVSREALEEISVHLSAVILVWTVRQLQRLKREEHRINYKNHPSLKLSKKINLILSGKQSKHKPRSYFFIISDSHKNIMYGLRRTRNLISGSQKNSNLRFSGELGA